MKSNPFARRVNAEHLKPVADPFNSDSAVEPGECPPVCPTCGGETLWFIDPHTNHAELVCLDCVPRNPTNELPGADKPKDGAPTTEQLKRHARAYADEHFPGWRGVTIRIRMGERDDGGCGELLLVMTNSVGSCSDQPEPTGNDLSAGTLPDGLQPEPVANALAVRPRGEN